jgi:hypothetical protein
LEDKVIDKLVLWIGKYVTMAGRSSHVKSVLTSIKIYYITILNIPVEVLMKIDSIRELFFGRLATKLPEASAKSLGI